MSAPNAAVSAREVVLRARLLRAVCGAIELALALAVVGSLAVARSADPALAVPFAIAAGVALMLLAARMLSVNGLRRLLGRQRFALHPSGRWIVLQPGEEHGPVGWTFDLGAPLFPPGPLVWPGLVLVAAVLVAGRGAMLVLAALCLHQLAAAVFTHSEARRRFRLFLPGLGLLLALMGLMQLASGPVPIDRSSGTIPAMQHSGPFVERSHLGGYLLMVLPIACASMAPAYGRYLRRLGASPDLRQVLLTLETREGVALLYALLTSVFCLSAFGATASCSALLALLASLIPAGVSLQHKRPLPGWAIAVAFLAAALVALQARAWCGEARVEVLSGLGPAERLIAVWAVVAVLRAARSDPWLVGALSGVLLHGLIGLDPPVPATEMLFLVLAAPCLQVPDPQSAGDASDGS